MRRQTFNEINITPLTDIFLVLLIIMMVIAPMFDQQGLKLAVPQFVEEQENQKDSKILTVIVTEDNKYYVGEEEIEATALSSMFSAKKEEAADGLMIQVEGNSDHSTVVKLMDEARNSGIESISITEI